MCVCVDGDALEPVQGRTGSPQESSLRAATFFTLILVLFQDNNPSFARRSFIYVLYLLTRTPSNPPSIFSCLDSSFDLIIINRNIL